MSPRLLNWFFGLVALIAIAAAIYFAVYRGQQSLVTTSNTPTESLTTLSSSSPSPNATIVPTISPSAKTFSDSQGLAVPNQTETVPSGGSLLTIATAHNVTIDQLVKVNGLSNADTVYAGQVITIPDDVTDTGYTVLFTQNNNRLAKEKAKVVSGTKSIYSDPVTATQSDAHGLFGISTTTPWSNNTDPSGTQTTLATSNDTWGISVTLTKQTDGFWVIKQISATLKSKASPKP